MNRQEILSVGRPGSRLRLIAAAVIALAAIAPATTMFAESGALRVHNIFGSNMVIQRDKPITIWGWAETGRKVSVRFGEAKAEATSRSKASRGSRCTASARTSGTGRRVRTRPRASWTAPKVGRCSRRPPSDVSTGEWRRPGRRLKSSNSARCWARQLSS